jgi:hypothetical protein
MCRYQVPDEYAIQLQPYPFDSNSHSCLSLQGADFEVKQGKWMIASSKQRINVSAYLKPSVPKVEPI